MDYINSPDILALYPDDSLPEDRYNVLSSLCSYGFSPAIINKMLLYILRLHFSDSDNLISAKLKKELQSKPWLPANTSGTGPVSGIVITSAGMFDPATASETPALAVKSGNWSLNQAGLQNQYDVNVMSGEHRYAATWQGSHTIFCLGKSDGIVEAMSTEVGKLLLWQSNDIIKHTSMLKFIVQQIGAVGKLKQNTALYVSPVTITYAVPEVWQTSQEAPRIKQIKLSTILSD